MIVRQVLGWKYSLTTFGHRTIQQNFPGTIFNVLKIIISSQTFCFLLVFSFGQFGIKCLKCERWMQWKLPKVGQTHMMTHTKREPRGQPRDPSLWLWSVRTANNLTPPQVFRNYGTAGLQKLWHRRCSETMAPQAGFTKQCGAIVSEYLRWC